MVQNWKSENLTKFPKYKDVYMIEISKTIPNTNLVFVFTNP